MIFCKALLAVLVAAEAWAGVWTGGGELLQDQANPWWLQNTPAVTYCTVADPAAFGAPLDVVDPIVDGAIAYWVNEFATGVQPADGPAVVPSPQLATQFFQRRTCDQPVDLRFQFGTLSLDQRTELGQQGIDPTKYVGFSWRSSYDSAAMHARGYIYLGADRGPLKFTVPGTVDNPWTYQDGRLLFGVLIHELGHVFGIPHTGGRKEVMGADFPEYVVSTERTTDDQSLDPGQMSVFHYHWTVPLSRCWTEGLPPVLTRFFGVPAAAKCLSFDLRQPSQIQVSWNPMNPWGDHAAGVINVQPSGIKRLKELVHIWLPPAQTVFSVNGAASALIAGPAAVHTDEQGLFYPASASAGQRPVFLQFEPGVAQIGGVLDGTIILNLLDPPK